MGTTRWPMMPTASVLMSVQGMWTTSGVQLVVGARIGRRDLGILEEVLVALELQLEAESPAEMTDRSARPASAEFDVTGEVHRQLGRDQPLCVRLRRARTRDRQADQSGAPRWHGGVRMQS